MQDPSCGLALSCIRPLAARPLGNNPGPAFRNPAIAGRQARSTWLCSCLRCCCMQCGRCPVYQRAKRCHVLLSAITCIVQGHKARSAQMRPMRWSTPNGANYMRPSSAPTTSSQGVISQLPWQPSPESTDSASSFLFASLASPRLVTNTSTPPHYLSTGRLL